jgi:hypothetical protein
MMVLSWVARSANGRSISADARKASTLRPGWPSILLNTPGVKRTILYV